MVRVSARTPDVPVPRRVCGAVTGRVHGYHGRTVRDVPVDGWQVVVRVRIRRLVCPVLGCRRQTFREQVPGLLERHQRRTTRLTGQLSELVKDLCGRASARLARSLAVPFSYASALRLLRRVLVPVVRIPRVIGVDDFALRRRHSYATIIINAETGERIEVLPDCGPPLWKPGYTGIRALRPYAGTDRPPTPRRSAEPCPTRSRSATAGTCGTTSPRPSVEKSPRTASAGRKQARPRPREGRPQPPASAGGRSTTCASAESDFWSALAD